MKLNVLFIILYSIIVVGFGFWWADNFDGYSHFKGDESFFEIGTISIISLFTLLIFKFINRKTPWWTVLLIPFPTIIPAVFISLFIPLLGLVQGTTLDDLRLYSIVYTLLITALLCALIYTNNKDAINQV